jgi:hypothetical protein
METSRRRYFAHHAHRSVGTSAVGDALRQHGLGATQTSELERSIFRVLVVAAPLEEPLEEAIWALKEYLEEQSCWKCSRAFCHLADLPAEQSECSDCLLLLLSARAEVTRWQEAAGSFCQRGQGVVAVAVDAETSPRWTLARVAPGAEDHPVLRHGAASILLAAGLPISEVPCDAQVLLANTSGAVAWSARRAAAGVFFTRLGHEAGLMHPDFRRLLRSALAWTVGR